MADVEYFVVTEDHLKLMRRMVVVWYGGEYGAPGINCKRPYGNSDVEGDISEILGWPGRDEAGELPNGQEAKAKLLHQEMQQALQVCLSSGRFDAGLYDSKRHGEWQIVDRA